MLVRGRWSFWAVVVSWAVAAAAAGCAAGRWPWGADRPESFPPWSEQLSTGLRGEASTARPSGFFTDPRSHQIEKSLGGGF
jgi:hypothetical protein